MRHQAILALLCGIGAALVACKSKPADFSVGPFDVDGDTGIATGRAMGVDFSVAGASEAEVRFDANLKPGEPDKTSGNAEITLADDLRIELEMTEGGRSVGFRLNGKEMGDLEPGDRVVIDADKGVTINGVKPDHPGNPPAE